MFSETALLVINLACIMTLVILLAVMTGATRMKGGAGWAALILVTTTIPAYLVPYSLTLSPERFLWFIYPAVTLNMICIPALWFFVHRQMDKSFRFTYRSLFHLSAAVVSLIVNVVYYCGLSSAQIGEDMKSMLGGVDNQPTVINNILFYLQLLVYFPLMILYVRRRMKYLKNNFSDSGYYAVRWTPWFIAIVLGMFVIIGVTYTISPFHAAWITPVLNTLAMAFLTWIVMRHSTTPYLSRLPDVPVADAQERESAAPPAMDEVQMREICDKVMEYLQTSKAYTDPEFSLSMLAVATGVTPKNLSPSINGYLHKNFFDLVNEMRVGEAKRRLLTLDENYTVESIYPDCGFSSARSFFRAFQKFEQVSPDRWRKENAHYITQK